MLRNLPGRIPDISPRHIRELWCSVTGRVFVKLVTPTKEVISNQVWMRAWKHRWELPGNCSYFQKYGNLPLYLDNYALFSLPPIFTNNLYTYTLRYIIYIVEPSGNIISNYHGTFIHIFMHLYYPNLKIYILNRFFYRSILPFYLPMYLLSCQHYFYKPFIFY